MPSTIAEFLATLRKASLPAIWSSGVKLVRDGAVTRVPSSDPSEIVSRVRGRGLAVAPTVTLYLGDLEWACDCAGKVDPCEHVAAAAIAAGQAKDATAPSDDTGGAPADAARETPEARAHLAYRLARKGRLLTLRRAVVHPDGREEPFVTSLTSQAAQRHVVAAFDPTHDDLRIDRIVGFPAREVLPVARMKDLLDALSASDDVTFEGKKVAASSEPILPRAVLEDAPNGDFILRVERDPQVTEVVAMGVALCDGKLRPLGETDTTGEMLERLPLSRTWKKEHHAELVTVVLPDIERTLPLLVKTKRLPRTSKDARPRIFMDLSHHGHTLSVLPTLVYGDPPFARVDGDAVKLLGSTAPVRRRDEENRLLQRLREELDLIVGRRLDLDGNDAVRFAAKLRAWQKRTGEHDDAGIFESRVLTPRVKFENGVLDVVFECETQGDDASAKEITHADAATVLRAFRDGLDLVPLSGGGWAPLPLAWLETNGHLVADLLSARNDQRKLATAALPALGELCDAVGAPRPLELAKLAPLLDGFTGIPRATLPKDLRADLRAYQQAGVDWLSFLQRAGLGAVLADDMGLGKTLQTIAVLRGRVLVVCPKSVVYNWSDEIARFRNGLKTSIYQGPKRAIDPDADVTLATYAMLRLDAHVLCKEPWDIVVLDEAQAIKNESSQTARAAFELKGEFRIALSGTPVENRLEELWSVMRFANPGLLGSIGDFRDRYVNAISSGDPKAATRLRSKIRPFVLRRMKRDVLPELPPRTDQVLHVELDDAERAVYDAVRAATKKEVAEKLAQGQGVLAALEALLRLRQASCHASLVPGQHAESSSKIERLLEALEDAAAEGHKALVFSQWTSLLDLVSPHLTNAGIRFTRLDGSTRDRAAVVAEFQDTSERAPTVMLVSLKAGGTGLNLTAADHVFLLDPWWNPAVEDQAADRTHRIGQERPVMVYRLVAKDTVEERISALQERKRALADVALGEANHAGGITKDELLALLE